MILISKQPLYRSRHRYKTKRQSRMIIWEDNTCRTLLILGEFTLLCYSRGIQSCCCRAVADGFLELVADRQEMPRVSTTVLQLWTPLLRRLVAESVAGRRWATGYGKRLLQRPATRFCNKESCNSSRAVAGCCCNTSCNKFCNKPCNRPATANVEFP